MRSTKKPEERKAEIIETARRLFEQNGYKATQVKDIVGQVGVAQGLFYYYFKSKEDVMEAVANQYADQIIEAIGELIDKDDALLSKINAIFNIFIASANHEFRLFIEMMTAQNGEIHSRTFSKVGERLIPFVVDIIEEGNKKGECKCEDPDFFVRFFISGLFSNINQVSPENKIEYLTSKLPMLKRIIVQLFNVKVYIE